MRIQPPAGLITEALWQVVYALQPHPVKLVGGAVRDAVSGLLATDIDLATTCLPEEVMRRLQAAGIGVIPTGLAHGTVTAVVQEKPFQITTLRRDVSTDGRHATVTYTTDFEEDAARRDFTFNALYMDMDGTITDFEGGMDDLKAGIVRFIGEAEERIQEDYLRILRYFRFYGRFGHVPPDADTRAALRQYMPKLTSLSPERITQEWMKLLVTPHVGESLRLFRDLGGADVLGLGGMEVPPLERHMALFPQRDDAVERFACLMWQNRVETMVKNRCFIFPNATIAVWDRLFAQRELTLASPLPVQLYQHTPALLAMRLALDAAYGRGEAINHPDKVSEIAAMTAPILPLNGADVMALGVKAGPQVGAVLQQVADWWLKNGLPGHDACVQYAKTVI